MTAAPAVDPPAGAARRADLDVLRLVAVLFLFVFHVAKVYDADPLYHVKHETAVAGFGAVSWWIRRWQMSLLFLISGWASAVAFDRRGSTAFLRRRLQRLGPPLLIGVVVLCPPIKWLEMARGHELRPSGLRVTEPHQASPVELLDLFFSRLDHFTWSHLWFLVYLLLFTLLALPVLRLRARTDAPRSTPTAAPRMPAFAPLPALFVFEALLRPRFGDYPNLYDDWANLVLFSSYFALGILLARRPAFESSLRASKSALAVLLVASTVAAAGVGEPALRAGIGAIVGWSAVAWALAAAPDLRWPAPLEAEPLKSSSLAIYVLHHTPLLIIAWAVTSSRLAVWAQVTVLGFGSVAATAILVALARSWRVTRRLFGLRPAGRFRPQRST